MDTKKIDVGVIVGRFQVHELHEAHVELIQSVVDRHDKVILFLGLSPLRNTFNNPLDFRSRKIMIQEKFPNIDIHYVDDQPSDEYWSINLDRQIEKWKSPGQSVVLYGGRDSFIPYYKGKFETHELEPSVFISGKQIRKHVINNYFPSIDYRAGIIAATGMRFPTSYQTVDIAVLNEEKTKVILVRKDNETVWRFPGGFSDTESNSLEEDAMREVREETGGIEIENVIYIGSMKINDWRYEDERDCIKTAFFMATYKTGRPVGSDDVVEAGWFSIESIKSANNLTDSHKILFDKLIEKIDDKDNR